MTTDIQQLADGVSTTIREWCERRFEAFAKTFRQPVDGKDADEQAIEARLWANIRQQLDAIPAPQDGKSVDEAALEARMMARILRSLDDIPKAKDGENGKDADESAIEQRIWTRVTEKVAAIPPPKAGDKGDKGDKGADHDPEVMRAAVQIEVARQVSDIHERVLRMIPVPKDGIDGKSITLADIAPLLEGEVSKWELDFERNANVLLQRAIDKLREPRDGKDAIGLADFDLAAIDGGRTIQVRLRAADGSTLTREVRTALVLDRGSYVRGMKAQAGDGATYGGSYWIAQCDTDASPGDSKDGTPWRLAVKRGKDAQ